MNRQQRRREEKAAKQAYRRLVFFARRGSKRARETLADIERFKTVQDERLALTFEWQAAMAEGTSQALTLEAYEAELVAQMDADEAAVEAPPLAPGEMTGEGL